MRADPGPTPACRRSVAGAVALLAIGLWAAPARAGLPDWVSCTTPAIQPAAELDAHLQLTALIQDEWRRRGAPVALISRSGLDLRPIGHRYSHAGFMTGASSVRQLYFDCAAARPRIFDEGLAGFVLGVASQDTSRFSVVWWPAQPAAVLAQGVTDDVLAMAILSPAYQAHAHAWSLQSQNCNQWVVEMLAASFGGGTRREAAQRWLRERGYEGSAVQLPWVGWLLAAAVIPHLGLQHHPEDNLQALRLEVSLPASVEAWVRRQWPLADRVEWCRRGNEVVVRRGWQPLDDPCTPQSGDERRRLLPWDIPQPSNNRSIHGLP